MPNALAQEPSAYLRQHQSNPVDWLPWGEPALGRARRLNKPILLSIGYSACHWCHVMARESFDDARTAALMNEWFVNVKVDREERPDIDAIYIRALQAMGRRPGWPLTMFLTPDCKPFWGGTYFPPEERDGLPAFREVLKYVYEAYSSAPTAHEQKGQELVSELMRSARPAVKEPELTQDAIDRIADDLLTHVDQGNGGLKNAPKFPYPALFRFLWNQGVRSNRLDSQNAVLLTLDKMATSGLFDHVGGGFFRYAVDSRWDIPHFEKMLCDNALLVSLYSEVYRAHANPLYRDVVKRTVAWLMRELMHDGGAFACSLDAESGGREGAYYLLAADEVDRTLGQTASAFREKYLDRSADFEDGKVLNRPHTTPTDAEQADFIAQCDRLLRARAVKTPPRRDDKILADANGLTIVALAEASIAFDESDWLAAAERAFAFVAGKLSWNGTLYHSWNEGRIGTAAILDDYADMALAAAKLFEVTGMVRYQRYAVDWIEFCIRHFRDQQGAFFYTPDTAQLLVARIRQGHDSVTPSGNGVIARVLSHLYYTTGDEQYFKWAQSLFRASTGEIKQGSFLFASLLDAQQFMSLATQVTIVGDPSATDAQTLRRIAYRNAPLDRIILLVDSNDDLPRHHPAAGKTSRAGSATAYVCVGTTCSLPLSNPDALKQALEGTHGSWTV